MRSTTEARELASRERRSPALGALFDALHEDGRHSILDLGPGSGRRLRILGRFATHVRFASVLEEAADIRGAEALATAVPANPARPYDVVLAWDALDRMAVELRAALIARLAEVSGARARLYAIAAGEGGTRSPSCDFALVERDRVVEHPAGAIAVPKPPILPAELTRVIAPFEIVHAFMLRSGAREYVAMRRE